MEFTDRYQALGIPYPDPTTMCKGECEGTGWVPVGKDDPDLVFQKLWQGAHDAAHAPNTPACDGWHMVRCPECDGTGKALSTRDSDNG